MTRGQVTSQMDLRLVSDEERLSRYVPDRPDGDCWLWRGARNADGYGQAYWRGSMKGAHRYVYTLLVGEIPTGVILRHTCDVPACVNPEHLTPGTHADNRRDCSERNRAKNANSYKTHCKRGHEFTTENTRIRTTATKVMRVCRTCAREDARKS